MTVEQQQAIDKAKLLAFINVVFSKDYKDITKVVDNSVNYIFYVTDPSHEFGKWEHIISKEWFDELLNEVNDILIEDAEMEIAA